MRDYHENRTNSGRNQPAGRRITSRIHSERPLDEILRERLHLRGRGRLALATIRAGLSAGDWLSRLFTGQPFFALRQSEDLLGEIAGLQGTALLDKMMSLNGGTQFRAQGLDTVPDNGPVLIAATHPTGLFEFCAHMQILRRKRPDLRVVANAETERFLGADMIIPVKISKENRAESAHSTRRAILDHLEAQGAVLIFGSGRVADQHEGLLVEPPWRGGPTELSRAANAASMYNDIAVDAQSQQSPDITFIHALPGAVRTAWGTEMPFYSTLPPHVQLPTPDHC